MILTRISWLTLALAASLFAQEAPVDKPLDRADRQPGYVSDFDIRDNATLLREVTGSPKSGSARDALASRRAAIEKLLRNSDAGRRIRITADRHGLVKTLAAERGALSEPSQADSETATRLALRRFSEWFFLREEALRDLKLASQLASGGLEVLSFQQQAGGVAVFQGTIKVGLDSAKRVLHVSAGDLLTETFDPGDYSLSPQEAVGAAYRSLGLVTPTELAPAPMEAGQDTGTIRFRNPFPQGSAIAVSKTVFALSPVSGIPAWQVLLETGPQSWYELVVADANGRLLFRHNLYRFAGQGRVWKQSPVHGEREVVPFPDTWLGQGQVTTTNNNADVYLDTDGNNVPDPTPANDLRLRSGRAFSDSQDFDFPAGEGSSGRNPREFNAAALVSAFYFVNLAHDYFYDLGFTEQTANFQRDNFGRGGTGADPVLVEIQDREVTNNAAFVPTPEGIPPRLELGLFTRGTQTLADDLDSAYDGMVVVHEYTHGVSTRLVGGGRQTSCLRGDQSGAMGEGWSDYFAMSMFENPVLGAYTSQNRFRGARRQSYQNNRLSYESLGNDNYEVHDDGEIWGAVLWDIRRAVGKTIADRLILQAMKLTPCNPSMVDGRDAILKTDEALNGGANRAALWQVFAERGLGNSASGLDGTISRGTVYNAGYDLPSDLAPGAQAPRLTVQAAPTATMNQFLSYRIEASDPGGDALRFSLLEGPDGMTVDPASGEVTWNASFVGKPVRIAIANSRGVRLVHGFNLLVDAPLELGETLKVSGPEDASGRALIRVPEGTEVLEVELKDGTGDADLLLYTPDRVLYGSSMRLDTRELLRVSGPKAGWWEAFIVGVRHYRDVVVRATAYTSTPLENGIATESLSGDVSSHRYFRISPGPDVYRMGIETYSGTGNPNLYVGRGAPPVCHFDPLVKAPCLSEFRSTVLGTRDTVRVDLPAAEPYFATVVGFSAYSDAILAVTLLEGRTLVATPSTLRFAFQIGRPAPAAQTLTIEGPEIAFNWTVAATVSTTRNWLRVSRASGTGKTPISISIDATGLTAGTYSGTVTVTAPQLRGSPVQIPVTLTVSQ